MSLEPGAVRVKDEFRKRVVLSVLSINLLVILSAVVILCQSKAKFESQTAVSTQNIAGVLGYQIKDEIDSIDMALIAIKHDAEGQLARGGINPQALTGYMTQLQSFLPELQGLRMTDARGQVLYGTGGLKQGVVFNMADRDYFVFERDHPNGELFIAKPVLGRISGEWNINIARRVNNPDGSFAGAVYGALTLDHFFGMFARIDVGSKGSVTLRSADDFALIARYPGLKDTIGSKSVSKELAASVRSGHDGATVKGNAGIDRTERMISYRRIPHYSLLVIAARAKEEYLADWRKEVLALLGLAGLFILATAVSSRMLLKRWSNEMKIESQLRQAKLGLERRVEQRTAELNRSNQQLKTELDDRIKAEKALSDSRQQLLDIIDFLPDATFVIDNGKRVIAWNRAMEEMTGIRKEAMLGQGDNAYTVPFFGERRQTLLDLLDLGLDDAGLASRYPHVTRRGEALFAEFSAPFLNGGGGAHIWATGAPLYSADGERIGSIESIRDITAKKTAEDLRDNDLALIENLLSNSPAGIRVFDGETGECLLANKSAEEIVGAPGEALLGQDFRRIESWRASGLLECAEQVIADGIPQTRQATLLTSFGKEVPVTYLFSRFAARGRVNLLVIGRDIFKETRLAAEKKRIEDQMLHAQKLESMGVLAGGIAHDFNNILTAIIGNADLAMMRLNPDSPVRDNLQRIGQAALRASDLAKQMLAYSGRGRFVIENIDVNGLVEDMLHMLEVSISKKAVLRLNPLRPLPSVEADATQLRQVIMNLVINASEAIGERSGVIALTTGCLECDRNYLDDVWLDENLHEGLYVSLEISDTGCGMSKETMGKIFDPFFTTKFTGRGLGMAAVLGIIRGHKGAIKVQSEPGKGSSFKILLPASCRPGELSHDERVSDGWQGRGTVLLADDEETIRALGGDMLRELGYRVVLAEDGRHALELFAQRDDICLVILDLTMPHLDGDQTFRELRRLQPDLKIVMSSGYNEQEVTQRFVGKGLAGFLQKPYKMSDLREVLSLIA